MDDSIKALLNNIDNKQIIVKDIKMDDYLKIFDETTARNSQISSEEEFKDIENFWMSMDEHEFALAEENLLDWAAATL